MYTRIIQKDLRKLIKNFPAVALLGPRQIGKTTLAKSVLETLKQGIYLDLEDKDDFNALSNTKLFFESHRSELIIIDEVQRMPSLFPMLRSEIDAFRMPGRFLLLGSASPELLQQSSETLAGRIVYKELSPLNILEIGQKIKYEQHWLKGGYPDALKQRSIELWEVWHGSFLRTYIERDLPLLGLPSPARTITSLLQMLSYNQGQILNKSEYAKSLGISVPTVSNMIDYLSYAYLIRLLPAYSTNTKKRLVKSPKVYIRDSGMLHHLLGVSHMKGLLSNPKVGFSWEGYVIEQLVQYLPEQKNVFYYRTQDGTEADLVIARYNQPEEIIEVKLHSEPKVTKSLLNSMNDLAVNKASIIVPGNKIYYRLQDNISVCSIDKFLEKQ
jgi:predicted AAA+ superfamily ATPase